MSSSLLVYTKLSASSMAILLSLSIFAVPTADAQTAFQYPIVDANYKQIGTVSGTYTPKNETCSNQSGNQTVTYVQTEFQFTSFQVNGTAQGGTIAGSGSIQTNPGYYLSFPEGTVTGCPSAGWSTGSFYPVPITVTLNGAPPPGQVAYQLNFTGPKGAPFSGPNGAPFAFVSATGVPIVNTTSATIGTLGGLVASASTFTCGSDSSYIKYLYVYTNWELNGSYNGSTFQGGGGLSYNGSNNYPDYSIQYNSASTSGCPSSGFTVTTPANIDFGGGNLLINGTQTNPSNYGVEFNGTTSSALKSE